jgi:hypothetical protein
MIPLAGVGLLEPAAQDGYVVSEGVAILVETFYFLQYFLV